LRPIRTETYSYDAVGNLTRKTDRKNQLLTYTYDQLNRLSQKQYPDNSTVNYTYDNDSRLTQVTDPTGTYSFTFDNMGRLTGTTTSYAFLTSRTFTTAYSYDAASNRVGFTDPESGSTAYVYDTLNRLQTLTLPASFGAGPPSFGFGYDALSRRTSLTRPNAVNTTYGYDNLLRLLNVTHAKSGTTIDGATYTLDNAGNRTAKTDQRTAVATSYGYDSIYQLLSATQGATTTESYTYDPVGNRTASLGVASYTNNSSNELTATSNASYGYDLNGNAVTKNDSTGITTYAWDFENRLTSVTLPGSGGTVSFKYDPFGRRIYKSSASGTSIFTYDADNLIEETNASGAVVARDSQSLNTDEPLAMLRGGATSYYHADGLGSVSSLSNTSGALAQTYTYDSFGKLTSSSGSLTNPFQYTARESESETGLYYYRARYYAPELGRFLTEDSARWAENGNFYAYAKNRPSYFRDPSGRLTIQPSFSPQCLADLMSALQILRDRIKTVPSCNCFLLSHGMHAPLSLFLDNPLYSVSFDPNGNVGKSEKDTLSYILGGNRFNVFVTPLGCNSGPTHLAQDLAHEFAHLSLGHASEFYNRHPLPENPDHAIARQAEAACGFALQRAGTTIVVH